VSSFDLKYLFFIKELIISFFASLTKVAYLDFKDWIWHC